MGLSLCRNATAFAGAQLDSGAEAKRVRLKLNAIADFSSHGTPGFWTDRDRAHVLVTLQDRVSQVGAFVESCRSALELVFTTLFPLNPIPQGLTCLMEKFRRGEAIKGFVREQLEAGARFTLALIRIHYPHLDLESVSRGLPPGLGEISLDPHYLAVDGLARGLIVLLERETDVILSQ